MAYQAAKSTAQLAVVLMHLAKQAPSAWDVTAVSGDPWQQWKAIQAAAEHQHAQQTHAPWLCQPYALNPVRHKYGRHPVWRDQLSRHTVFDFSWLLCLPSAMITAASAAAHAAEKIGWLSITSPHGLTCRVSDDLSVALLCTNAENYS